METEQAERTLVNQERRGDTAPQIITIEGLDDTLLEKLVVLDGDLAPLRWAEGHFIAIAADLDDYGNLERPEYYPAVGDTLTISYGEEFPYIDSRTGELIDENSEAAKEQIIASGAEVYVPTDEELKAFQDACQPVYQQMVDEGICTQEEMDEMLAIVEAAK